MVTTGGGRFTRIVTYVKRLIGAQIVGHIV
jgi:hypothetical protein